MLRKFINRKEEIKFLENKAKENNFNLIVIYGRRRIGKTELIRQFIKNKPAIYFLADKRGTRSNLERFKEKIAEFLDEPKAELDTFDKVFSYLAKREKGQKLIIAIDEFSYLVEKDDSIPSVFQLIVDEELSNSNFFLILSGSSISLMEKGVLSAKSPLYGRRTGQFKLKPLNWWEMAEFFPKYDFKEIIEIYSVLGGIPFYLSKMDEEKGVRENIKQKIIKKGEVLYEEADFLLKEELRDPSTYKSILEAIAGGSSKITEIANRAKVEVKDLDKYLKVLINLDYVKKLTPVTEKPKSKKTIYQLKDNFFRFWFRFCLPKISDLEIGEREKVLGFIEENFKPFVGRSFELACEEFLKQKGFLKLKKVGKWWGHYRNQKGERKEVEIDIVGLNEESKEILFGECKWQEKVEAKKVLEKLKEKASYVKWEEGKRKEYYALFAKSFKRKLKEKDVFCFELKQLHSAKNWEKALSIPQGLR